MTIKTHGRMFTDNSVGISQLAITDGTSGQAIVTDGSGTMTFATVGAGGAVGSSTFVENRFTGDSSTTTFTLSTGAPYEESILVFVDGVAQPTTSYTLPSTTSITLSDAPATGVNIRVCHLGIASSVADNSITGAKLSMGGDSAGDVLYYNGTDYQKLGIGTAGQHLATNSGATAPEWATPTVTAAPGTSGNVLTSNGTAWTSATPATPQSANEIAYVLNQSVASSGTWTKPAGINRIFLYITERISNDGAGQASFIYLDVTNVTSYAYNVYTYGGSPTKYGALTFNGRTGSSSSFT
ncbi:uncharacterized protein METZ01_LOCUS195885, partial [marine metagenome]